MHDGRPDDRVRPAPAAIDHRTMVDAAAVGLFACDLDGAVTYVNPAWTRLTGLSPAQSYGNGWTRAIHPDDLASVWERWDTSVRTGEPFRATLRYRHVDGSVVHAAVLVVPTTGENGSPMGWAGSAVDVTAHEALLLELDEKEYRFRTIVELSTDVIYRISSNPLRVDYLSPSVEALVGRPAAAFYANPMLLASVLHPDDLHLLVASLDPDQRHPRLRLRLVHADGRVVHVESHGRPLLDERGVKVGMQGALRDIGEQHALEQALQRQATTDALTGLPNRRALLAELERHAGEDAPLAVLYLDVNDFKGINDRHGHAAGDRVLVALADRLRRAVRPHDLVARLAGDEFVVLCPGAMVDPARSRLAEVVGAPVPIGDGTSVAVTISVGGIDRIAGDTAHTLLERADAAMYRLKRSRANGPA